METSRRQSNELLGQLLNTEEVATLLGVSVMTVRRLKDNRIVPHYKVGRSVRFSRFEIETYVRSGRVGSVNEYEYGSTTKAR
ncbi:MAG: helix-turn-helix domain-containing protein [Gammaproteobacteria bacterium]|jgi:excisionase family DNA binding protein|nr:helix-turn-helix domain-containing protein [Gammaproteobacteria bacterium]